MYTLNKKTIILYSLLGLFIIINHYFLYKSDIVKIIDYKTYDFVSEVFKQDKYTKSESNVVVVDIDEKSLDTLGQWPWPRILVSQVITKINSSYPSAIGLNIMFPEKDRTSPNEITSFYKNFFNIDSSIVGIPKTLQDNDLIFSHSLAKSNSVMSIYLSKNNISNKKCKISNFLDIKSSDFQSQTFDYALCNTSALNHENIKTGFVNVDTDEDGILRRVPLLSKYNDTTVPAFSVATLMSISPSFKRLDKNSFDILNHKILTDDETNVLLNFYDSFWYKKISVIDLLSNHIPKDFLSGKIVLLGSSATSLNDQVIVRGGENMLGVQVQVTMIDNILNDDFIVQPQYYKILNILISLFLSFLFLYLLITKHNNLILALFGLILISLFLISKFTFEKDIYISTAYFLTPFLMNFFIVIIIYIIIDTYDRYIFKEELNRLHIADLDEKIRQRTVELELSHKHIQDNINYASLIQNALLPQDEIIKKYTKDSLVIWIPKDTVGGDIYLISELKSQKEIIVMVIDGAGHGVSGAFVTLLVKAIEAQIIAAIESGELDASPSLILKYFNKTIKIMLKQEKNSKSNVGFDGGVIYYNKETNVCKYAGAKTPLYIVNGENIEIIKSDRANVGFIRTKIDQKYTEHDISIKDGTKLYLATDGIYDQEGLNNSRLGKKAFESLIVDIKEKPFDKQKEDIINKFDTFKNNFTQSDDLTILGLKF